MKRIVVCCDGTWKSADQESRTNVVKIAAAILPVGYDGVQQVVYYDEGVGTRIGLDRFIGGAFGAGLFQNVCEAYRFVSNNFEPGDEIWFLGFSRGAYTVRSTAGLIRKCGVLRKTELDRFENAYRIYRSKAAGRADTPEAVEFREKYSQMTRVRFIGVWDTVGSLGIPGRFRFFRKARYEFHDVDLSRSVDFGYQALAIDEHRETFAPAVWHVQEPRPNDPPQEVEQAWFPGAHSDVGGGSSSAGLSDAALAWMAGKARGAGLEFSDTALAALRPNHRDEIKDSRRGLYLLWKRHIRRLRARADTEETISQTAAARWDDPGVNYRPEPLADFHRRFPLA